MNKVFILEQAIKEISETFDLKEKLGNIETPHGFCFDCWGKEYQIHFTPIENKDNFEMICVEIEDEEETLFTRNFYIEDTYNSIVAWLLKEIDKNKKLKSFNLQVDFDEEMGTLWVATDCSSGCEYNVIDKDTFLSAMEDYFDTYLA